MVSFAAGVAAGVVVLALLCWCAAAGFRNGDRPADAWVSAVLRDSGQPDESRPPDPRALNTFRIRVGGLPAR